MGCLTTWSSCPSSPPSACKPEPPCKAAALLPPHLPSQSSPSVPQTFSNLDSEVALASQAPGRLGPTCLLLWVTSLHQPFAPEGFQLAVSHRRVLCPQLHQDKFPLWCPSHRLPVPTRRTLCVGGCGGEGRRKAWQKEEYFQCYTSFTSVYPSGLLWMLPVYSKKR